MLRSHLMSAVHLALLANLFSIALAQEIVLPEKASLIDEADHRETGLITTGMSARETARWKEIEELVFAVDRNDQPLHPTLRWLWEWVETSGHAVYVRLSMTSTNSTSTAGNFKILDLDQTGERHVALISLNLANIDRAYIGPRTKRENGLIPFLKLKKVERYAEVLGHEMSHAVYILTNLERVKKVIELVDRTNEMLLVQQMRHKGSLQPELRKLLSRRDVLLQEIESRAEDIERRVWLELSESRYKRHISRQ